MAHELDSIALNLKDQKALQEYFAQKKIGQKCKLEVEFEIIDMTENMVNGMIEEANPVNYTDADEAKDDAEDDASYRGRSKGRTSSGPNAADRYATM